MANGSGPPVGEAPVEIYADTSRLEADLKTKVRSATKAGGRQAGKGFSEGFRDTSKLTGQQAADAIMADVKRRFEQRMAEVRHAFASGLIDRKEFEKAGRTAAEDFNKALLNSIRRLEQRGQITPSIFRQLSSQLKVEGVRAGEEMSSGIQQGLGGLTKWLRTGFYAGTAGALLYVAGRIKGFFAGVARDIAQTLSLGGQIQARRQSFENLAGSQGLNPDQLLAELRRGTRATASDFELMDRANNALQAGLKGTSAQWGEMARDARRLGQSVGIDAATAFERMTNAIVHNRPIIASTLGLVVNWKKAYDDYAAAAGKTADQLTATEKQQIRLNSTLEVASQRVNQLGPDTLNAAQRVDQLRAAWSNTKNAVAQAIATNPGVVSFLDSIAGGAESASAQMEKLVVKIQAAVDTALQLGKGLFQGGIAGFLAASASGPGYQENLQRRQQQMALQNIQHATDANALLKERNRLEKEAVGWAKWRADGEVKEEDALTKIRNLHQQIYAINKRLAQLHDQGAPLGDPSEIDLAAQATAAMNQALKETARLLQQIEGQGGHQFTGQSLIARFLQRATGGSPVGPGVQGFGQGTAGLQPAEDLRTKLTDLHNYMQMLAGSEGTAAEKSLLLARHMKELGLSWDKLPDQLKLLINDLVGAGNAALTFGAGADTASEKSSKLLDTLQGLEAGARGVLSLADSMGVLDEKTRRALQGVVDLAGGVRTMLQGIQSGNLASVLGGAFQGVTGLIGSIGGLFGKSAKDKQRDRLLAENNQRLTDLKNELGRQLQFLTGISGDQFSALLKVTQQAASDPNSFLSGYHWADLKKQLAAAGVSLDDVKNAAQQLGITWDDSHVAESFMDFARALRELDLEKALGTFQGQMQLLQTKIQVLDITDPIQQLELFRQQLLKFTSLPGAQKLAGLDLSTAEGQAQMQQILAQLLNQFAAGQIDISQLGGLSASDFESLLSQMAQLLQQAGDQSGSVGGLQHFSGISELQANRLLSADDTKIAILSRIAQINAAGFRGLGVDVPKPSDIAPPPGTGSGGSTTVNFGDVIVDVGGLTLPSPVDPKAAGEAFGRGFIEQVDRKLYRKRVAASRVQGRAS